jgi:hypothetical protein
MRNPASATFGLKLISVLPADVLLSGAINEFTDNLCGQSFSATAVFLHSPQTAVPATCNGINSMLAL